MIKSLHGLMMMVHSMGKWSPSRQEIVDTVNIVSHNVNPLSLPLCDNSDNTSTLFNRKLFSFLLLVACSSAFKVSSVIFLGF
jgi:hypothetical protein